MPRILSSTNTGASPVTITDARSAAKAVVNSGVLTGGVSTARVDRISRNSVPLEGYSVAVGVAFSACSVDKVAIGAANNEASESAGEGLRIAMYAIVVVLSGVEGKEGVFDSVLESDEI